VLAESLSPIQDRRGFGRDFMLDAPTRRPRWTAVSPLVGRDGELAVLCEAVEAASAGTGTCVVIEGSAGMGKSRLLGETEKLSRARRLTVLSARAVPRDQNVPFSLALALFAPLVARADAATRARYLDGAAQLAEPLLSGLEAPGPAGAASLQYGLFWLAVNITQGGPIAVLVDDAHWADDASLHVLAQLARSVHELPAVIALGSRITDPAGASAGMFELLASGHVVPIQLGPLDADAVAELVRQQFPDADDAVCRTCADVTVGNPFHLRELLRCMHDEDRCGRLVAAKIAELGSVSVSRAALFRLARLGGAAVAVARALAVLGDDTPLRRVAELAELSMDEAAAAADTLVAEGLVTAGRSLSFGHPLIGELILAERPPLSVAQEHARAAALLAADHEPVEKRASHLLRAPAAGDPAAVATLVEAAQLAHDRGAPDVAVGYLTRALEEPPARDARRDILCRLGAAGAGLADPRAVGYLQQALDLSGTPDQRVATRRLMGRALAAVGRSREAALCLEAAIGELRTADDREAAGHDLLSAVAEYLTYAAVEPQLRPRALRLAAELLRPNVIAEDAASRAVLASLAMCSAQQRKPVEHTIALAERAWGNGALLSDDLPDRTPWITVNWAFALAGDYRQAMNVATAARNEARRLGLAEVAATASGFRSIALLATGHIAAAQEEIEFVLLAGEREGWRRYRVAALSLQAILCAEVGDAAGAAAALEAADGHGDPTGIEVAWRLQAGGALALARRDLPAALAAFCAAGEWLREHLDAADVTVVPWRCAAARTALAVGDPTLARELIVPERDLAVAIGDRGRLGRALAVLAVVERGAASMPMLQEACELLTESGQLLERARAQKDMGLLLRCTGDRVAAKSALAAALDTASRLGASALAGSIREELATVGARPRTDRTSGPSALTPSERRIAGLVAQGMTNGRIAQELFVTPKTVEYHLRNVFQKLGVSSRAEVAAALGPVGDA
jgi:DNA-binding CsgD family transcriptional regulator/tetratricopeptide (TPR) repeat protein